MRRRTAAGQRTEGDLEVQTEEGGIGRDLGQEVAGQDQETEETGMIDEMIERDQIGREALVGAVTLNPSLERFVTVTVIMWS